MDCLTCRGACCETFTIPSRDVSPPGGDERRWLELHATANRGPFGVRELTFACRCTALTGEGWCGIYESRPRVCRDYVPGGPDCLAQVRARRTPEQYARIRGAMDPLTIHGATA